MIIRLLRKDLAKLQADSACKCLVRKDIRPLVKLAVFFIACAALVPFFAAMCTEVSAAAGEEVYLPLKNAYTEKWPLLVPERQIIQGLHGQPSWKILWDEARKSAKEGKYEEASIKYETLISGNMFLKEPQWELARIWFSMLQFDKSAALLEGLIEDDPERLDYVKLLAKIMREKRNFSKAEELYKKILTKEPGNVAALSDLFFVYRNTGQKEGALMCLEEMYHQRPADFRIRRALVELTFEQGHFQKTRRYITELVEAEEADLGIISKAAQTHDELGLENLSVPYWQRVLTIEPENKEAHLRLASFYEKEARVNEALPHMLVLLRYEPANTVLLKKIGRIYQETGRFSQAMLFFKRYLTIEPSDREVLRAMVHIHAAQGNKDETIAYIEKYLAVPPEEEPVDLKKAARRYDATGKSRDALPLYRHLLTITPDDPDIIAALASDIMAIEDEERSLSIWQQPDRLIAKGVEVYRSMAALLESLGRKNDLLQVLEVIHELDPADERTTMKLALLYSEREEYNNSLKYFKELEEAGQKTSLLLMKRGIILEELGKYERALKDFEELLVSSTDWKIEELGKSRSQVMVRCLRLAGELGKLSVVRKHLARLKEERGGKVDTETHFIIGRAFVKCGAFQDAEQEYRHILTNTGVNGSKETKLKVLLAMADLYEAAFMPYEVEQALRSALALNHRERLVLKRLFAHGVREESRSENAEVWLNKLYSLLTGDKWEYWLLFARMSDKRGNHWVAADIDREVLAGMLEESADPQSGGVLPASIQEVHLDLGRFMIATDELQQAEKHLVHVGDDLDLQNRITALALLQKLYKDMGDMGKYENVSQRINQNNGDLRTLLLLAEKYGENGMFHEMLATAQEAYKKAPDSIKAVFLIVIAKEELNDTEGAIEDLLHLHQEYPRNTRVSSWLPHLLYKDGEFDEALERCEDVLASFSSRPDILLLKARILWSQKLWQKSITTYQKYLEPGVDQLLEEKFKAADITVPLSPKRNALLELLKISPLKQQSLAERYLQASHAVEFDNEEKNNINRAAAPLFARYRWQQRFADEMAARNSMKRREYIQAVKQFEVLVSKYPDEDVLMFDLAGLYSHFDRLGDEAAIYEKIMVFNPHFAGLEEAMLRNRVKRRPRAAMNLGFSSEEGYDDYISIKQQWTQLSLWSSPYIRQELDFSLKNNSYSSVNSNTKVRSNRAFLSYHYKFLNGMSIAGGGGVEALGSGYSDTFLVFTEFNGKLGDRLDSHISFTRDVVADTIASLQRNIVSQDFEAGFSVDLSPRLIAGADYGFTDFSDDNRTKGYDFWTSYIVHSEPKLFTVGYSFTYKDSLEGPQEGGLILADGFAAEDHPYWAPKNYWINEFNLFYKFQFSDDYLARGAPRYVTIEYVLGYDAKGFGHQTLKAGAVLELTANLIVESGFEIISSQIHRMDEFYAAAVYRW